MTLEDMLKETLEVYPDEGCENERSLTPQGVWVWLHSTSLSMRVVVAVVEFFGVNLSQEPSGLGHTISPDLRLIRRWKCRRESPSMRNRLRWTATIMAVRGDWYGVKVTGGYDVVFWPK